MFSSIAKVALTDGLFVFCSLTLSLNLVCNGDRNSSAQAGASTTTPSKSTTISSFSGISLSVG